MTDMIEKMARAIYAEIPGSGMVSRAWETDDFPLVKELFERCAKAALSALEEPSDEMVEAGANLPGAFQGTSARYARVRETFTAMIRAAKEGE